MTALGLAPKPPRTRLHVLPGATPRRIAVERLQEDPLPAHTANWVQVQTMTVPASVVQADPGGAPEDAFALRKSAQNTARWPLAWSIPIDGKSLIRYPLGGRHCRKTSHPCVSLPRL